MMFSSFHVCGMMLLFSDMLYMLVRYASPSSHMWEVPDVDFMRPCRVVGFALFYCLVNLCCGGCYFCCLQTVCFPIYVSVCIVCFMFNCVGDLFVECVCYLYG